MYRRRFLEVGAVFAAGGLAGCSSSEVDGEVELEETVFGQTQLYNFELEEGDTLNIYADQEQGLASAILVLDPMDEIIFEEEDIQTEGTWSVTAEMDGIHSVQVVPVDRVRVVVGIERS